VTEDVVAAEGDSGAVQKPFPARQSEIRCLRRGAFGRFAIAGRSCVFGVTGHGCRFDRRNKNKIVRSLNVKEPGLLDVMLEYALVKRNAKIEVNAFMKAIEIMDRCCQIEPVPGPIEAGIGSPLQMCLVGEKSRELTAAQFDLGIAGNFGELERIHISRLRKRSENAELRLFLVLDTKIGAARLL